VRARHAHSDYTLTVGGLRSVNWPFGRGRAGGGVTALASSSTCSCSGVNVQPIAPRFRAAALQLRAPINTLDTVGREQPVQRDLRYALADLAADASSASITRNKRSSSTGGA
jgi:hypothetical protein